MKLNQLARLTALTMTALTYAGSGHASSSFGVEARSLAMGNASVATADIATAALTNPAMMALQKPEEDFSLLLPSVGIFVDDSDGMLDTIDQFQVESDACIASNNAASAACTAATATLTSLGGKSLSPQFSGAVALGFAGETYSFALSARSDIFFVGGVPATLPDGTPNIDTSPSGLANTGLNQLLLQGVKTTEVGVSVAGNMELLGFKFALGLTPKVVGVESLIYSQSVATASTSATDLIDENSIVDLGSFTTLDAGLMMGLTDNIQLGLVARNLISDSVVDTVNTVTLNFDTQLRAGLAYNGDIFTLGVDMDLTENDPIISTFANKTRYMSVGLEIDAFDILQLRVGMQKNIASGASEDALVTAGVGLSLGIHVDVAVISGTDVLGAYVQTGFRF